MYKRFLANALSWAGFVPVIVLPMQGAFFQGGEKATVEMVGLLIQMVLTIGTGLAVGYVIGRQYTPHFWPQGGAMSFVATFLYLSGFGNFVWAVMFTGVYVMLTAALWTAAVFRRRRPPTPEPDRQHDGLGSDSVVERDAP